MPAPRAVDTPANRRADTLAVISDLPDSGRQTAARDVLGEPGHRSRTASPPGPCFRVRTSDYTGWCRFARPSRTGGGRRRRGSSCWSRSSAGHGVALRRCRGRHSSACWRNQPQCRSCSISAGPGWGKTTLLAQWSGRSSRPFAWVTIDDDDNDPIVLLHYVAAALDRISPVDASVFEALASPDASAVASVLPRVAAALATMTNPRSWSSTTCTSCTRRPASMPSRNLPGTCPRARSSSSRVEARRRCRSGR